jgi:hypothetical protein
MTPPRQAFLDHFAAWILALFAVAAFAQDGQIIPFDSPRWDLIQGRVVEHLGRNAFMGTALVKDAEFQNGVIEFDLAVTGQRSYPGIVFRWVSPGNTERVYVRPHQSNTSRKPEVIQYAPGFNGVDSWQLYNGEGFTGFAEIPYGQWVHYKVEVSGTQVRLFIADMSKPVMLIHDLKRGVSKGKVGIAGQLDGNAYYSSFSYRSDDTLRLDPPPCLAQPRLHREWQISQPSRTAVWTTRCIRRNSSCRPSAGQAYRQRPRVASTLPASMAGSATCRTASSPGRPCARTKTRSGESASATATRPASSTMGRCSIPVIAPS